MNLQGSAHQPVESNPHVVHCHSYVRGSSESFQAVAGMLHDVAVFMRAIVTIDPFTDAIA